MRPRSLAVLLVAVVAALQPVGAATDEFGEARRIDSAGRSAEAALQFGAQVAMAAAGPVVTFFDSRDGYTALRSAWRSGGAWTEGVLTNSWSAFVLASDGVGGAWMFGQTTTQGLERRRTTGDGAWSGPVIDADVTLGPPQDAAGAAGRIALAWSAPCVSDYYYYNTPSGIAKLAVFDVGTHDVGAPVAPLGDIPVKLVATAVSPDKRIWFAATSSAPDVIAITDGDGTTWSAPQIVPTNGRAHAPDLAVLGNGDVMLVWQDDAGVRASVRNAITKTWSLPRTLSATGLRPRIAPQAVPSTLPLMQRRTAAVVWIEIDRSIGASDYRPAPVPALPGFWSAPQHVAVGAFATSVAGHGAEIWLAYDSGYGENPDVFAMKRRASRGWFDNESVHDQTPEAAYKYFVTLAPVEDDFEAVWGDTQGTSVRGTLRRARLPEGETIQTDISGYAAAALAPDGSLGTLTWDNELQRDVARVDDAATGESSSVEFGEYAFAQMAPLGERAFGVVAMRWDTGALTYRIYDGAWQPEQSGPIARSWGTLTPAGGGRAWLTWSETDEEATGDVPVTYRIMGMPLSVEGLGAPQVLATGASLYEPYASIVGDGAGGIALTWTDNPNVDESRTLFATAGEEPIVLAGEAQWVQTAVTPAGDAIVTRRDETAIHTLVRSGGGAFHEIAVLGASTPEWGSNDYYYPRCGSVSVIAASFSADVLIDGAGNAHLVYHTADGVSHASLPSGASSWSAGSALIDELTFALTSVSPSGDAAVMWRAGAPPDTAVMARVMEAAAMTTALTFEPTNRTATLTTPRGIPIAGRTISCTTPSGTADAVTDVHGSAVCPAGTLAAAFAGDGEYQASSA